MTCIPTSTINIYGAYLSYFLHYIYILQNIYNIYIYIYIYIYTYNTVICLEYSIIMTTENIYICTVRKSRHNNYKVMYS